MNDKHIDYSGQKVFIGMDVHSRQYTVTCRCDGQIVKRCRVVAVPAAFLEFIGKYFKEPLKNSWYGPLTQPHTSFLEVLTGEKRLRHKQK